METRFFYMKQTPNIVNREKESEQRRGSWAHTAASGGPGLPAQRRASVGSAVPRPSASVLPPVNAGSEAGAGPWAGSEQDVVLQRPRHPVDHQPPVVAQGGEEPGVGGGPVHGIHAVLVLLVRGDGAVLRGLLTPARTRDRRERGGGLQLLACAMERCAGASAGQSGWLLLSGSPRSVPHRLLPLGRDSGAAGDLRGPWFRG